MPAKTVQNFEIFLASPGDVDAERTHVRTTVEEINRTLGKDRGFVLTVVGWDTDARPGFGPDPQSQINNTIATMADYELFVGIMWNRFGTETQRAGSGTEEEFNRAVEAHDTTGRPEIMLYFGEKPTNLRSKAELEQKAKVVDFREKHKDRALSYSYTDPAHFATLFRRHLELWILSRLREQPPAPPPAAAFSQEPPPSSTVAPSQHPVASQVAPADNSVRSAPPPAAPQSWVLLGDGFFLSESVVNKGDGTIVLELTPQNSSETALLSALQQNNRPAHQRPGPISYAHGDDAAIARVTSAESRSSAGKTVWTINLRVEETNVQAINEAVLGGITPAKAAELRARLLLLNEPVEAENSRGGGGNMFTRMILSPLKTREGIFPEFWARVHRDPAMFLPLARLWAIYLLKVSAVCDYILELKLELVENNAALDVSFRGQRRRGMYSAADPSIVAVSGRCKLE